MFKRHKIAITFVLFFSFILLFIAWPLMKVSYHSTSPIHITTEKGLDFSWSTEAGYDIQGAQFGCLSGSPYVYVVKRKTIKEGEITNLHESTLNLIDIEKGERILRADWINESSWNGNSHYAVSMAFAVQNQPFLVLHRYQLDLPYYFRFLPQSMLQSKMETYGPANTRNQSFLFDSSGLKVNNKFPYWMFPPLPGSSTFTGIDTTKKDLAEYQIASNGDCLQIRVWNDAGMPFSCFPLEDGSYYGLVTRRNPDAPDTDRLNGIRQHLNTRNTHTFFLRTNPPTYRDFTPEELAAIHPKPSDDLRFPFFNSLSRQANQPCILFDAAKDDPIGKKSEYPIYEIQVDKIASSAPKDIFKSLGVINGAYPLAVMHDNKALILYNYPSSWLKPNEPVSLSIVLREINPDGTPGSFGSESKEFPVSGMIDPQVLDSERLIFIRDHALWTVQWDGSGEQQVFPRK